MIVRPYWLEKLYRIWDRQSIVWFSGVWRSGKTTIARMIDNSKCVYLNCDIPAARRKLVDPIDYLASYNKNNTLILDEIHRLDNPSLLLKTIDDKHPNIKVLAISASTLPATSEFNVSLTEKTFAVQLPPVLWDECIRDFNIADLDKRLLYEGLPEVLLDAQKSDEFYAEWIDRVFAREIQDLFNIRNREGFRTLFRLLIRNSGGQLDVSKLAQTAKISRPTAYTYLNAMEKSHLIHYVRPFHGNSQREITKRPKCYAFDTGFITYERGWTELREEDHEVLWKHLVLDMLRDQFSTREVYYWKDKSNREIDFILRGSRDEVHLIECAMDPDRLSFRAIHEFRRLYPNGKNLILTPAAITSYKFKTNNFELTCSNGVELCQLLNLSS
ncbi:MAG: DUF4143 domain-containing protein [Gammaproteobacteria bacterium]|nr:DUF4143 domain-containing protein [Gammaproteobacteria bacterium]